MPPTAKSKFDDRRAERRRVHILATFRHSMMRLPANLYDITPAGCRVESATRSLRPGQSVTIKPADLAGITGHVRWADGAMAGIEFDRELYLPVFDHLVKQYAVSDRPLD